MRLVKPRPSAASILLDILTRRLLTPRDLTRFVLAANSGARDWMSSMKATYPALSPSTAAKGHLPQHARLTPGKYLVDVRRPLQMQRSTRSPTSYRGELPSITPVSPREIC